MAIEGKEQLKAWLAGKPHDVQVAIAFRAAARGMPFLSGADWTDERFWSFARFAFRCNLTTYSFCFQKDKTSATADPAYYAADATADPAYDAAAYAADAAYDADYADTFWKQLNLDIQIWEKERGATVLLAQPLWNISHHDATQAHWQEMTSNLPARAKNWDFWIDYYERLLKGGAPSQDYLNLLADIAQMENKIWGKNTAQVNEIIAEKYEVYKERQRSKAGEMTGAADKMNNLKANVNMWMAFPTDTAKTANFVADKIDAAIDTIRHETNETEGIELFEKISEKVRCHAKILENDEISKDEKIEALEAENAELNKKIAELIAKLESDAPLEVKQTLLKIFDTFTTEIAQKAGATIGEIAPIAGLYFFLGDPAVFTAIMGAAAAMRLGKSK